MIDYLEIFKVNISKLLILTLWNNVSIHEK